MLNTKLMAEDGRLFRTNWAGADFTVRARTIRFSATMDSHKEIVVIRIPIGDLLI